MNTPFIVVRRSNFTLQTAPPPAHVGITNLHRELLTDIQDPRKSLYSRKYYWLGMVAGPSDDRATRSLNRLEYIHDKPGILLFIFMIEPAFLYLYS